MDSYSRPPDGSPVRPGLDRPAQEPLLSFVVAGVQKSGTTWLSRNLALHESLDIPRVKELHLFDDEELDWENPDLDVCEEHFRPRQAGLQRGDLTPIYTFWPRALERLKTYVPDVKVIISLRHPVFRAFSHWRMERGRGKETLCFSDAIREPGRSRIVEGDEWAARTFTYVERGFYLWQLDRALSLFARDNLLFVLSEDFSRKPRETIRQIETFLGVPHMIEPRLEIIRPPAKAETSTLSDADFSYLQSLYEETICGLTERTGLDVDHWLSPRTGFVEASHG